MYTATAAEDANRLFGAVLQMWTTVLQTGSRFQEESVRQLAAIPIPSLPLQPWPKQPQEFFIEALHAAQKNVDEAIRVVNESTRRNLDLLERGFKSGQAESADNGSAKAREAWEATLGAIRTNTEALVHANARMLESWTDLGRRLQ